MRSVLFISLMNGHHWGGSEELWYQTALFAAKNGYRVGCAFYEWPQKQARIEQLKEAGCDVYLLSNKGREKRTLMERLQHKITKRQVKQYSRSLPVNQFDVTVINLGFLEIISHYWRHFHKYVSNYVLLFHVHNDADPIKPRHRNLLKKWVLNARKNLFASEPTQRFIETQIGMQLVNAGILINPITFEPPLDVSPYPPLKEGQYVFIVLASLEFKRKAQDNLVKALSLQKWKERNWVLYLYGHGESERELKRLVNEYDLTDKVVLKGHTNDVKDALAEAHLALQLTHIDAMPLAVVEAMAMAKPVAVSDVGDMPKWVEHGYNGWVAANASVEAIQYTLEKAWQDREKWKEMGEQSYQMFKKRFPASTGSFLLQQIQ